MSASMSLRPWASTYVKRRIRANDCLHIDVFAYQVTVTRFAIKYELRRGGRGAPLRTLVFVVREGDALDVTNSGPAQVPLDHPSLTDMYLTDPILMTGRVLGRGVGEWFTAYHHMFLRDIATLYPISDLGCRTRSVRFHYFPAPDLNPNEGFVNFYAEPVRSYDVRNGSS
jgi:hypothetical protein